MSRRLKSKRHALAFDKLPQNDATGAIHCRFFENTMLGQEARQLGEQKTPLCIWAHLTRGTAADRVQERLAQLRGALEEAAGQGCFSLEVPLHEASFGSASWYE